MKIDRDKIKELSALDDVSLWKKLKEIANAKGVSLPEKAPSHSELEKLRVIMLSDKINPIMAMRILNEIKRGRNNG